MRELCAQFGRVYEDESGAGAVLSVRCRHLTDDDKCVVHGTDQQPEECKAYDAENCWYKANFEGEPVDFQWL